MGSRGSFLESGGFNTPARWHTVDYVDGIKVLAPKDPKASIIHREHPICCTEGMVILTNFGFLGKIVCHNSI